MFLGTLLQYTPLASIGPILMQLKSTDRVRLHCSKAGTADPDYLALLAKLPCAEKGIEVMSVADIGVWSTDKRFTFLDYDFEPGVNYSPTIDLADPVEAVKKASEFAHSAGKKFSLSAAKQLTTKYAIQFAPFCDYYNIQAQTLQYDAKLYRDYVASICKKLRAANPKIAIACQVSTQQPGDIKKAVASVIGLVQGVSLWYGNNDLAILKDLLAWYAQYR